MDQENNKLLLALLRSAIRGNELSESEKASLSDDALQKIFTLAKYHDLAHLIALALKKNGIAGEIAEKAEHNILQAAYRHRQMSYEYTLLCDVLEEAKIPFIPLKGSVIRKYYPEAWMRTSCDIDILVHEEDTERVTEILTQEYEYTYKGKGTHDISLYSPNNIHVELHFDLVEGELIKNSSAVLGSVWENAILRKDCSYCYDMVDEIFYFHHIAHMAKHFENGGCGIRSFIDLFILDNLKDADELSRNKLLETGNLLKFADAARYLSGVWFGDLTHNDISLKMEDYITFGGIYGNDKNRIAIQQQKKGGKLKYALSRIFLSYENLKFHYPILQKHKCLTPFIEVFRWFKLVFCGGARRAVNELKYNSSITQDKATEIKRFLTDIGL